MTASQWQRIFRLVWLSLTVLFLTANDAHAVLNNGANANNLIGQYATFPTVSYTKNGSNDGPNLYGLRFPEASTLDAVNHRLFIADTYNHRILVYNLAVDNILTDKTPDYVLGQPDFTTSTAGTTQARLIEPSGMAFDATSNRLFVADRGNNRVIVFDVASITNGENAINVLGQINFTTLTSGTTQAKVDHPDGVSFDTTNNRLFVADTWNTRVMVFDVASITNGENAINVLGQTDFTTRTSGTTQSTLSGLSRLLLDTTTNRLFVADTSNSRVMVFDVAAITDGENAINVLGQADFTTSTSGTTQSQFIGPTDVVLDETNNRLFVVDSWNHRVMVFDVASITDGENAINVLGQTDYITDTSGTTQAKFNYPRGISFDATNDRLFVVEYNSSRVMIFDVVSITNGETAIDLIGQYAAFPTALYTKDGNNNGPNLYGLSSPSSLLVDTVYHRLFVVDGGNKRILVYDLAADNTLSDKTPDYVLGQPDFTSNTSGVTQANLSSPAGISFDATNNRLFVSDASNSRVMVFDVASITNGENAINILGQTNFTTGTGGATQATLDYPQAITYDATNNRLFVVDNSNSRVMVFDVASITDGENAINVLGQTDFTTASLGITQAKFQYPEGISFDAANNRLFVADGYNHRIMVFDVASITNGENAINVLGQTNFTTGTWGCTQAKLYYPDELSFDAINNRLFVVDHANQRIIVFDVASITNGKNAINVLGQTNFTTRTTGVTQSKLNDPSGVMFDAATSRLFVADSNNARIMVFDATTLDERFFMQGFE